MNYLLRNSIVPNDEIKPLNRLRHNFAFIRFGTSRCTGSSQDEEGMVFTR